MSYVLPFGKYRGKELHQVPSSYLSWLMRDLSPSPSNDRLKMEIKLYRKSIKKTKISCR
jgi:uncharacterized protein (DUF3820 family)